MIDDASDYHVERVDLGDGRAALRFAGELRFRQCFASWAEVRRLAQAPGRHVALDLSAIDHLDGAATALLLELRSELDRAGVTSEIVGAEGSVRAMLELYGAHPPRPSLQQPPAHIGAFDQIGRETLALFGESKGLDYIGDVVVAGMQALRRPRLMNWADVPKLMERAGADGLPIILMINFLVGLVTAFQAALQLKQFGANIFVADLVGLSITRELAPLMTAIIVAGRSGAAFSAELGTMRVSEEIDALRTLSLDPYQFLVFPRVVALVLVLPLLTILADLVGIAGGLLVAMLGLDLTANAYLIETQKALSLWDVSSGCLKTAAFGLNISLIACQRGLSTHGGAEGVGRATTSAVVTSLFAIVVVDAIFTVVFNALGM
ncbi:MAG: MlaE family lipid ABC transporter permease subunit [Deltaproteobacteria bacterium]|nr:MlaE family lipid ABC transporter permease subunit [Deltaproteobacteria bacterium]